MKISNDLLIESILDKGRENEKMPIPDGIINPELFFIAPVKILFILKEPYDIYGNKKSHIDDINSLDFEEVHVWKGRKTEKMVSTIISCLFQNLSYDKFNKLIKDSEKNIEDNKKKIVNDLKSIAWINVNKYPGQTTSSNPKIRHQYYFWKDILYKQIETYNPDVIIFGRTFFCFEKDLKNNLGTSLIGPFGGLPNYYIDTKNHRLLIDSYHPSYLQNYRFREKYIDNIVRIIKNNR